MGKVLFLGVEGSGKSCLTAALVRYFEAHAKHGWSLRPENKEAFSFSTRMPKRLAAGELPALTVQFRHLHWSLCYQGEAQGTLDVLDYPGEIYRLAFLDPEDDSHPDRLKARQAAYAGEIRELLSFAKDADQIFVLFNLSDSKNLDTDDANLDAVWVTVQALKILGSLESKPQLTLLVTQADRLANEGEDVCDVHALLRTHVPIIVQHCPNVKAVAVSALDAENKTVGLKSLVRLLLAKTRMASELSSEGNLSTLMTIVAKHSPSENRFWSGKDWFVETFDRFSKEYARLMHVALKKEDTLCVYDFTFWGSVKRGMAISEFGIAVITQVGATYLKWAELDNANVKVEDRADGVVVVGKQQIDFSSQSIAFRRGFCRMLKAIKEWRATLQNDSFWTISET